MLLLKQVGERGSSSYGVTTVTSSQKRIFGTTSPEPTSQVNQIGPPQA
jgi:hypothetical protein